MLNIDLGRHLHYLRLLKKEAGACERSLKFHGHYLQPISHKNGIQKFIPDIFAWMEANRIENLLIIE